LEIKKKWQARVEEDQRRLQNKKKYFVTSSKMKWIFCPVYLRLAEADRQNTEIELEGFLKFIENLLELLVSTKILSADFTNSLGHFIRI